MSLFSICQAIQDSSVGTSIRESVLTFPIIEGLHVLGLASSVGLLLVWDLRLVGAIFKDEPAVNIFKQIKPWMLAGFGVMMITGAFLFWSEAAKAYMSNTFRLKLLFLVLAGINAGVFEWSYLPASAAWDVPGAKMPTRLKVCGWVSIGCWTLVILFGRWTAYGMK